MGRALAELLQQVPEAKRPAGPLLDHDTTELPPEADVRALLESAELDVDAAISAARADGDVFEGDELPAETLQTTAPKLLEAVGAGAQKGTRRYPAVVIRPGRAKGTGRRYYSPKMLEANAANFGGVTCYFNHEDLAKLMQRGHGSRDPRDVCGWLQEGTWWDPRYTEPDDAAKGRLPGAVMGHVDLLVEAADRVDALPQAFSLSICMDPTRVAVGRTDSGELAPCVEGIVPKSGSLDLITGEAGAGGKLLERLRESAETRYGSANADLTDERLIEAARARPDVLAVLREPAPQPDPPEEDDVTDIGKLVEAVQADPNAATKLVEALAETPAFSTLIEARVEAEVSDRVEDARDEARAEGLRDLALRDMRDEAHRLIEAAAHTAGGILTPAYVDDLKERFTLREGQPSAALDLYDQLGEQGEVVKPAIERLRESVTLDIQREERKLRESSPTFIRDLAAPLVESAGGTGGDGSGGGSGDPPAPPADPMADRLGLDTSKVREYQGV